MDLIQVYVKHDLYEVLEVDPNATTNDIKKKYKKLAIKFHPDKYLNSDELTNEEKQTLQEHFNLINISYDILSNDENRVLYDNARKEYKDSGQLFDLKKQFQDFSFNYGDKDTAKNNFENEKKKKDVENEILAEQIRENTKKNLDAKFDVQKVDNFDELLRGSASKSKKEYFDKFNNLFDQYRKKENPHSEIIAWNGDDNSSSLDNAFELMGVSHNDFKDNEMSLADRMKAYQNEYDNLRLPEPKTKKLPKFTPDLDVLNYPSKNKNTLNFDDDNNK